uniref:B30.2/SPRY domain-containing protein n=1 Tax=Globodera rostochiensis TaxID=31243 RepID=A0A914IE37_GLORO
MFIPTKSTYGGHITANQENLGPTFTNLDQSEEVRLLRARNAQLERQQTMNYGKTFEQIELEHENKELRAELAHQKLLIAHMALQIKVEEYQNKQHQKTIDELTDFSIDQFSLETDQKALSATIDQMEEYQKQQQQNIIDLQKTVAVLNDTINGKGLIPQQNRWDSSVCHKNLTLSEPSRLIVQKNGKNWESCAVLAERAIRKDGIVYFEVKVLEKKGNVSIGLGAKQMAVVDYRGTYSYQSAGYFWGHEVDGCGHTTNGRPYINGKPEFGVGDVVGCGVNLATRQIIYTKNGRRLDTANLFVDYAADLFPRVKLYHPGDKIEANFGPNFKFDIAEGI